MCVCVWRTEEAEAERFDDFGKEFAREHRRRRPVAVELQLRAREEWGDEIALDEGVGLENLEALDEDCGGEQQADGLF